jgi:hypothetical protein
MLTLFDRKPGFPRKGLVAAWEPFRQVNVLRQSVNPADTGFWTRTGLSAVELVPGGGPGGRDAWRVREDGSNGGHILSQSGSFLSGTPYIMSVCVNAAERSLVLIDFPSAFDAQAYGYFNATTGVWYNVGTAATSFVESLGSGWHRISLTATATGTSAGGVNADLIAAGTTVSYQGDPTKSLLIAEPQLEQALPGQTTPSPYIPTDALQLLNQSPRWKRGAWQAKRGSTDGVDTNDFAVESRRWVFDGIDNYADLQTEDFGGQCSLFAGPGEAWSVAVVASAADGADGMLVARGGSATNARTFSLHKGTVPPNQIIVWLCANVTNIPGVVDALPHFHCITWDGTTAKYYRDGDAPVTLNVGAAVEEVGQRIILGARTNGTSTFLNGSIYAPYFASRAWSPAEVARLRLRYLKPQLASVGVTIP